MLWWRRCLVFVPVLSFVGLSLLWSCGGGSGSSTTATPLPVSLISVAICGGTPFSPTPTPRPTSSKTPKPTPTPMCSALSATSVASPGPFYFNAQGTFQTTSTKHPISFADVTNDNSTSWFPSGDIFQIQNGIYNAPSPNGCACVSVQAAGLMGGPVLITIGNPSPACTPCPAP